MSPIARLFVIPVLFVSCTSCGEGPATPGRSQLDERARYQVTGWVEEVANQGFPIEGAQVRLVTSGLSTTTLQNGTFAIVTGPSIPDTQIEVSKAGFDTLRVAIPGVNGPAVHVQLPRTGGPPNYAGSYTFTVGDGSGCPQLPAALRQRSYPATMSETWPFFEVRLGGNFLLQDSTGNRLHGIIRNDVELHFDWVSPATSDEGTGSGDPPDLAEQLPDGTTLVISGALTPALATDIHGTLNGMFALFDGSVWGTPKASCSGGFPYSLTR
jgi:hypothetical protein